MLKKRPCTVIQVCTMEKIYLIIKKMKDNFLKHVKKKFIFILHEVVHSLNISITSQYNHLTFHFLH